MGAGNLLNTYVIGFDRAIRETVEVKGGKMRPYVQLATGDLFRKEGVYQRTTGGGLPSKVTNRFGDSPVSDIDYSRRRTSRVAYQDGQFMDWADVSKMGVDPRNAKLQVMKNKFLRQEDITLDQALLGSAKGGVDGETFTYLTNSKNMVANEAGFGTDGSPTTITTRFTYKKFLLALEGFGNNNVDVESASPVFKISWAQWKDMMDDDNFINFDYTAQRPQESNAGSIYDYMGAKFCISNIIPWSSAAATELGTSSTDDTGSTVKVADSDIVTSTGTWDASSYTVRLPYAFMPEAALLEVNPDLTSKISERADKSFNYYAYMKAEFGAVRMEEEKVIVIPCVN
tara:strand:+ start:13707 stop:14735 length:1029 start_codon:yes stop_codon:yes gene_type:complete